MNIFDASTKIHPALVVWPNSDSFERRLTEEMEKDGAEVSVITMGTHTGTHIDAPRHFVAGGTGIDSLPLEALVGPVTVVDVTEVEGNTIEPKHLEHLNLRHTKRLLFKTQNSVRRLLDQEEFTTDYVSLSLETAQLLVDSGVQLIGVDYLSVEKKGSPGHPVHVAILSAGIVIIEGVRLIDIEPGEYNMAALPMNIVDGDGAPTRVLLMQE